MYKSANVTLIEGTPVSSLGSVVATGVVHTVAKSEDVVFAGTTEANLQLPPIDGTFAYVWLGTSYGTISQSGTSLKIPKPAEGVHIAGVARCTYSARGVEYRLTHTALVYSEYSIVVFFAGAVT
jgi:hypothetical protein